VPNELTEDEKVAKLGLWSLKFKAGVADLVKAGHDPDELNEKVAEAEKEWERRRVAKAKQRTIRGLVQRF